jgi:hypothetical protein
MKNLLRSARVGRLLVVLVLAISVFLALSSAIAGQAPMRRVAGVGRSTRPSAKPSKLKRETRSDGDEIKGISQYGAMGIDRITSEIMQAQEFAPKSSRPNLRFEREIRSREKRKLNPDAPAVSSWVDPAASSAAEAPSTPQQIHTVGSNFIGATLTDTAAFPPDSMGAAGPSQFVVFVNGRIRSFIKATGIADGVLNADPDVFFAPVSTPSAAQSFSILPAIRRLDTTGSPEGGFSRSSTFRAPTQRVQRQLPIVCSLQ